MIRYRRMTQSDRYLLSNALAMQKSVSEIADLLGKHRSSIYRELNRLRSRYEPDTAHNQAKNLFKRCRRPYCLTKRQKRLIKRWLRKGFTPDQIAHRAKLEGIAMPSKQTIYSYLKRTDLFVPQRKYRGGGRIKQRNAMLANKLMIHKRPTIVRQRDRLGDWERDGMYIADRRQLLVCVERKSRYLCASLLPDTRQTTVAAVTKKLLQGYPVHTVTNDNGSEFRNAELLPYATYYCDPMKPQQRGTVENTIGLLRKDLPRSTKAETVTGVWLKRMIKRFNHTPRKDLGYRTTYEVMINKNVALAT